MEKMRENLSDSIVKIQSASAVALKSKNEMEKAVEESEAETSLLTLQIQEINTGAEDLYSSAQVSDNAVQEISKEVTKVTLMISSQSAMVEESAASITQMAASISSLFKR